VQNESSMTRAITVMRHLVNGEPEKAANEFPRGDDVVESMLDILQKNRMSGYFHTLINNSPLQNRLTGSAADAIEKAFEAQSARARENLLLLEEIKQRFEDRGIAFITLKGLYISQRFFGDISNRFMWDIDLLVHPHDLSAAIMEVEYLGLAMSSHYPVDVTNPRWGIHAVELAGDRGKVDIHIALRHLPGVQVDLDHQWRNARQYDIDGIQLPCASDEDTLFLCCLGLGTDMKRGRYNLRKIWDAYVMLRQMDAQTDWHAFLASRQSEGALKIAVNTLALVIYLVDCADECPDITKALHHSPEPLVIDSRADALALCRRGQSTLHNHLLFSRLLPISPLRYWSQWLVTAPSRRLYYWGTGPKRRL
jgi:hypothetical protein